MKANVTPHYNHFINSFLSLCFSYPRIKCICDGTRDMVSDTGSRASPRTATVEIEVEQSLSGREDKSDKRCCCCPATFKSDNHRTHVCYCPLYDVKHILCPVLTPVGGQEDCGCSTKCRVQPLINHCVTYTHCTNECRSPARSVHE